MKRIKGIFNKIYKHIYKVVWCNLNAIKYYRKIGVKIGKGSKIYSREKNIFSSEPWCVTIGENCHITSGCRFITHDGGTLIFDKKLIDGFVLVGNITVGNNVYFGLRVMVMPGVTIGNNVIIGAGSIVTHDIPDNSVAVGVPARVIKTTDEYLETALSYKNGNGTRYYHDLEYMHSLNPRNHSKKR